MILDDSGPVSRASAVEDSAAGAACSWPLPTLGLFAGYGGLELGLERAGIAHTVAQAEIDPWCREVERRHWPDAVRFEDVREVRGGADGIRGVDLVCGGFPCQPVSVAGKRLAQADARWLWPEFARIIRELQPAIVVAENVPGLRTAGLRDVLADLAAIGFDAEWTCFRAWDLGAPHERNRMWLVAWNADRCESRAEPGWLGRAIADASSLTERNREQRVSEGWQDGVRDQGGAQSGDAGEASDAADPAGEPGALPRSSGEAGSHAGRGGRGGEVAARADSLRRLEQARRFAIERGWAERCGWTLDPAPRVDDGPAEGLARGGRERARKAAGNGVVVACAQAVGEAIRECVEVTAR